MGLAIGGAILYVLVSVFNDGVEDQNRWKILVIAIAAIVVEVVILRLGPPGYLSFVAPLGSTALVALSLIGWCKLSRSIAAKVAGAFLGVRFAFAIGAVLLQGAA